MRIIMNGTTITGSVSEVLATLTHLGFKASDTTPEVTAQTVTMGQVAGITVTDTTEAKSIVAAMRTRGLLTPADDAVATPVSEPKLTRDGVIQQAIADVKDLLSQNYSGSTDIARFVGESLWFTPYVFDAIDEVLFTVNADKRTVHAIVRRIRSKTEISEGRAKCAPGDVFNEHIGKAIALRRALGLEVPVEYFTVEARDRDDLAVGDVVRGNLTGNFYELTESIDNQMPYRVGGIAPGYKGAGKVDWDTPYATTLINDSARHTAPDLEVSRIIRH